MKHKLNACVLLVRIFFNFLKPKTLKAAYGYLQELQRCNAKIDEINALPASDPYKADEHHRYVKLFCEISMDIGQTLTADSLSC